MSKTCRRCVSPPLAAISFSFILVALGSTRIASAAGPWYLDVDSKFAQTFWQTDSDLFSALGLTMYTGTNICRTYNSADQVLFGVGSALGVNIENATGAFWAVSAPPPQTFVERLAQPSGNAAGAWWEVSGGPVLGISSGTTDKGVSYQELRVYTGFAEKQTQPVGNFFMPVTLGRYWLTQVINITAGGGMASCSGSKSAPPGCDGCDNN